MEFTLYEVLGVSKTASEEEIRSAYKKLAKKYHPDKHAGNPVYEEHFKKINAAYQTLSNPDKRRRYDLKLEYISQQRTTRPSSPKNHPASTFRKTQKASIDPEQEKKFKKYAIIAISFIVLFICGALWFYHYMNKVSAKHHLAEAKKKEASKYYVSALQEYSIAIKFDEDLHDAYEGRGDIRIQLFKDYEGASEDYSKALEKEEKDFQLYFKRAKSFLQIKVYERGVQDLDSAIALNSSYDSLYFYRAEVNHFIKQDFKKAIPDYERIIRLNKDFSDAWMGRALCFQSLGEYQKSISDFNELIRMIPEQGDVFYYRAFSKMGLKDTSGACTDWFEAERLNFSQAREAINTYCTGN